MWIFTLIGLIFSAVQIWQHCRPAMVLLLLKAPTQAVKDAVNGLIAGLPNPSTCKANPMIAACEANHDSVVRATAEAINLEQVKDGGCTLPVAIWRVAKTLTLKQVRSIFAEHRQYSEVKGTNANQAKQSARAR